MQMRHIDGRMSSALLFRALSRFRGWTVHAAAGGPARVSYRVLRMCPRKRSQCLFSEVYLRCSPKSICVVSFYLRWRGGRCCETRGATSWPPQSQCGGQPNSWLPGVSGWFELQTLPLVSSTRASNSARGSQAGSGARVPCCRANSCGMHQMHRS